MSVQSVIAFLFDAADELDRWADESVPGGWSTHQVQRNRELADKCRRHAASLRHEATTDARSTTTIPPFPLGIFQISGRK